MPNFDPAQIITALAVFIPALFGAIKTYKNSSDADKRLKILEDWQQAQDAKLKAILDDQAKAFKEQGQHRYKLDHYLDMLRQMAGEQRRKLDSIPTRSEYGYRRDMELTPTSQHLPTVAPPQPPMDEYPDLDPEFKPKKKKR